MCVSKKSQGMSSGCLLWLVLGNRGEEQGTKPHSSGYTRCQERAQEGEQPLLTSGQVALRLLACTGGMGPFVQDIACPNYFSFLTLPPCCPFIGVTTTQTQSLPWSMNEESCSRGEASTPSQQKTTRFARDWVFGDRAMQLK